MPEPRRSHERCLALREQIVKDHSGIPEYLKELGIGHRVWGQRQEAAGLITEPIASFERARDLFERLVRDHPNVADYQWRLGGAYQDIARTM